MRGREKELAFLQKAVAAKRSAVVVGEPGIGKTTILEALAALLPSPARVVRCLRAFRWPRPRSSRDRQGRRDRLLIAPRRRITSERPSRGGSRIVHAADFTVRANH
jgi:Mg-chelatase subunit ChlI